MNRTSTTPNRRTLLGAAAAAGMIPALVPVSGAAAAESYVPRPYPRSTPLDEADRHLVGRFCYGITRGTAKQVRALGGGRAWFDAQLDPSAIDDPTADDVDGWWPSLGYEPARLWSRHTARTEAAWQWMQNYQRSRLNRRIRSRRQVLEVMTELWENHLNVPAIGEPHFTFRKDYGDLIRRHALGRYDELLFAAVTHPAMLIYLDNAVSTANRMNENLGRELLELHSVGLGAAYTEDDVKSSARILTGWRVDLYQTWDSAYQPDDHWVGPVRVLGFADPNPVRDGRSLTRRYTDYLARHPSTAHRIARKLAVKFVRDDPPAGLVDRLADVYLSSNTEIVPVLEALVSSPEFAGSVGAKVRDPADDLVASYRLLGVDVRPPDLSRPDKDKYAANAMLWQAGAMGLMPFAWPRPDGAPLNNQAWASPSRMLATFNIHRNLCGGWYPKLGARYRPWASWVPEFPLRFDLLVDHLSVVLLQRRSTPTLLQACCEAVGYLPDERITADHRLIKWDMPRLLTTFLDSPAHLTR